MSRNKFEYALLDGAPTMAYCRLNAAKDAVRGATLGVDMHEFIKYKNAPSGGSNDAKDNAKIIIVFNLRVRSDDAEGVFKWLGFSPAVSRTETTFRISANDARTVLCTAPKGQLVDTLLIVTHLEYDDGVMKKLQTPMPLRDVVQKLITKIAVTDGSYAGGDEACNMVGDVMDVADTEDSDTEDCDREPSIGLLAATPAPRSGTIPFSTGRRIGTKWVPHEALLGAGEEQGANLLNAITRD